MEALQLLADSIIGPRSSLRRICRGWQAISPVRLLALRCFTFLLTRLHRLAVLYFLERWLCSRLLSPSHDVPRANLGEQSWIRPSTVASMAICSLDCYIWTCGQYSSRSPPTSSRGVGGHLLHVGFHLDYGRPLGYGATAYGWYVVPSWSLCNGLTNDCRSPSFRRHPQGRRMEQFGGEFACRSKRHHVLDRRCVSD